MDQICKLVKKRRIQLKMTQADIARHLKFDSSQFISNIERGHAWPPGHTIKTYAKVLQLHPRTLITAMTEDFKKRLEKNLYRKSA